MRGLISASLLLWAGSGVAQQCPSPLKVDHKPQVFILTDVTNEPDDSMSLVRLALHSDQYNVTGLVATTSFWLNSTVRPEAIYNMTDAYAKVVDNLNLHTAGKFPTADYLASLVRSGHPVYGTAAIGKPLSTGASHLIDVADGLEDDDILHVCGWGGVNTLGEALQHVRTTRTQRDQDTFIKKLRVYTISDQDNAGPWIRLNFPQIPYIVSLHGFNQYGQATWVGFNSGEEGGPDPYLTSQNYSTTHFQLGPLGAVYPDIKFGMEGDTPTFLHIMQNGINGGPQDHPEWGGWGGRYTLLDPSRQTMVYANAADQVIGIDNKTHTSAQATIWRWRQAYQDEMSARVQWSILSNYSAGSHPPVVSVNGSCGSDALSFEVDPEQTITLDGSGTYDPDANITGKNPLEYKWWQYVELSEPLATSGENVAHLNFTLSNGGSVATLKLPTAVEACYAPQAVANEGKGVQATCQHYHVILEVKGSGSPPIRRYKRVILKVQSPLNESSTGANRRRDEL